MKCVKEQYYFVVHVYMVGECLVFWLMLWYTPDTLARTDLKWAWKIWFGNPEVD